MRHLIIYTIFSIVFLTPSVSTALNAQTVTPVEDKNKRRQLEREVWWTEWGGHRPGWFYWLIEIFQDDAYRDKDRRNILQLLPTLLVVRQNQKKAEEQKERVEQIAQDKLFILIDHELDYAYPMIKTALNEQRDRIAQGIEKGQTLGVYPEMQGEINNEYTRIEGRITALKESVLSNADRQKGYQTALDDMRKLALIIERVNRIFQSLKQKP